MPETIPAQPTTNILTTVLNKNLALLLIFPALLGGCEQFASLCFKSFTLLRYYSPTQVPIDGILVLIQAPLFLVFLFLKAGYDQAGTKIKTKWFILVIFSLFIMILIALIWLSLLREDYKQLGKIVYLITANLAVIMLLKKEKSDLQSFNKKASYVIALSIIFSVFYNIIFKPNYSEIGNVNKLTAKIKTKYPGVKLLYCNDKYLSR